MAETENSDVFISEICVHRLSGKHDKIEHFAVGANKRRRSATRPENRNILLRYFNFPSSCLNDRTITRCGPIRDDTNAGDSRTNHFRCAESAECRDRNSSRTLA
jgi:hypothetical protein